MVNIAGVEDEEKVTVSGPSFLSVPEGTFPDFELGDLLVPCGGLSLVRARHLADESSWILLLVAPHFFENEEHLSSFVDEMAGLSEVEDDGLLAVAGAGESNGWAAVVYEDFPGIPLLSEMKGKMHPPRAVKIVGSAAYAVHAAHEAGHSHRDIHPGWILVHQLDDGELNVKLAGVGVVSALFSSDAEFLQSISDRPNELRSYLAPEQLVPGAPSDYRADIYTLSAITYRLLVGNPPGGFTVLPSSRADVNRATDDIVLKAMHTDRTKRYETASAFGEKVKQVGSGNKNDPLAGLRYMRQQNERPELSKGGGPSRLVPGLVLAGLLLIAGVGAFAGFKFLASDNGSEVKEGAAAGSTNPLPASQSKDLKQVRELMNKGEKEAALAVAASLVRNTVRAGEKMMDPAAIEAAVLMSVEAGDADAGLDLANMKSPKGMSKRDAVDWRRVEALTKQLEVGREQHRQAMKNADAARKAGNPAQERMELARAAGFLPEHAEARDRANFGRQTYDPRAELERRMQEAQTIDGMMPEYVIRENDAELHLDLSNNPQLKSVSMLNGLPITHLDISKTGVSDLSPLKGMPLQVLRADNAPVADLSPLRGAPLRMVSAVGTQMKEPGEILQSPMLEAAQIGTASGNSVKILPPKPGRGWLNRLGMRFDPVIKGGTVLVSDWEVRRGDFRVFAENTSTSPEAGMITLLKDGSWGEFKDCSWDEAPFAQTDDHPVVGVSHVDAVGFCEWLTQRDRDSGDIGPQAFYRLPTSSEWSLSAGMITGRAKKIYPWGMEWPANRLTGNFPPAMKRMIHGQLDDYHDGYAATSPVGSFRGSLFSDMGGNVREWCSDAIILDDAKTVHVVRGAAWGIDLPETDSYRTAMRLDREDLQPAEAQWSNLGFRLVVDLGLGY